MASINVFVFDLSHMRPSGILIDLSAEPSEQRPMKLQPLPSRAPAVVDPADKEAKWSFYTRFKRVDVTIEPPATNAECPITLGPILGHTLDFLLPDHPCFIPGRPDLCAMRLPCGHVFSSFALAYHWYKNGTMMCPMCRRGPDVMPLNSCLPAPWRERFLRHIRDTRNKEANAEIRDEVLEMQRIVASDIEFPMEFNFFVLSHPVTVSAYLYGLAGEEVPLINVTMNTHPWHSNELVWGIENNFMVDSFSTNIGVDGDEFVFVVDEDAQRRFRVNFQRMRVAEILFKAHLRTRSDELIQICESNRLPVPRLRNSMIGTGSTTAAVATDTELAGIKIVHPGDFTGIQSIELRVKRVLFTQIQLT